MAALLLLLFAMPSVAANFSTILNSDSDLKFLGDATASTDHIDLTKTQPGSTSTTHSTGKAYYSSPFRFKNSTTVASFSTDFTYKIGVSGAEAGDGMAFFVVADPKPMVGEKAMGLGTDDTATNPFLAVEFDTYKNNSTSDPFGNHIGIDLSNMTSVATYNGSTLLNLLQRAWIDYDAATELLQVRLANESSNGTALRPSAPVVSAQVNLTTFFHNSDILYVGFSAATWDAGDLYQIYSWNFNITQIPFSPSSSNRVRNILIIVFVVIPFLFICFIASVIWVRTRKNRQSKSNRSDPQSQKVEYPFSEFRYADLSAATRRFSEKEILGKGGFGCVYRGILPSDGSLVAVKVMSTEGHQQFLAELSVISRLRHKNLVSLRGWCQEQGKLILVYDYMPNGSLDKYLFSPDHFLSWSQRYDIIKGVANGLAFLHGGWDHRIVHRDIKAANVLLDINLQARLGDFGLAKLMEDNTILQQTMTRAGTSGYIAPELAYLGKASEKSDIYSFGILLLEVACGRSVLALTQDREFLLDWVWEAHSKHDLLIVSDPQLNSDYNEEEMKVVLSLGLLCTHPNAELRPNMRRCCLILNGEAVLPDLPDFKPTLSFGAPMLTILSNTSSSLFSDSISHEFQKEDHSGSTSPHGMT